MGNSKKWSEQCLIKDTVRYYANGEEKFKDVKCLDVCISGKELFKSEFINGKYKDKKVFMIPYDFIVLLGSMGPVGGRFFEAEYTIGGLGTVYRALIQAVNPVEDIQLIIATLKQKNLLPAELKVSRAWLREDIDQVNIGGCYKDENGEVSFCSGCKEAKDSEVGLLEHSIKNANAGTCIEYYRGDCREVWIPEAVDCSKDKVFVCGVNGDDPEFAQDRHSALADMWEHIMEATEIARDYNVPFFYLWAKDNNGFETDGEGLTGEELVMMIAEIVTKKEE